MVIEQGLRIVFGAPPLPFSIPPELRGQVFVGDFIYPRYRLVILGVAIASRGRDVVHRLSHPFGRVVRAGVQNPDIVGALGISLAPYMTAIAALGVGLAGLAGVLLAPISGVHPAMGAEILTAAFVVVVIGGLGSFWGVIVAAMLVGVVRGRHDLLQSVLRRSLDVFRHGACPAAAAARATWRTHREVRVAAMRESHASLIVAAFALVILPFALDFAGLPLRSSIDVVVFAIACMGLNILVGHTGLVSFGHGAWFGLAAYAAALSQRYWFPGAITMPALFAMSICGGLRRCSRAR